MSGSIQPQHTVFALDCPDAVALAEFYATLLGWEVVAEDEEPDWVEVRPPGDAAYHLACQQVEGYRAPEWPDGAIPQQAHLDFYVESIPDAEPRVFAAGGTRHEVQPSEDGSFVVYLDPVGHPFCLCRS
ncbi:VOC family protein [Rothia sp. AR01]|uniref:VOC family protein n=1 Tax=Rothia santali TaxID=2949643 RepID=A0A9X2HFI1_9MICC|nr:VOC family protein [Rothia santali]MCP3424786.1 VOC family protein [Rothia santali]